MFRIQDPYKTILIHLKDQQQLAVVKVDLEQGLQMEKVDSLDDFVNKVLKGDKGVCLNTDLTATYIEVVRRVFKTKQVDLDDHVITITRASNVTHYSFK